MLLSHQGTRRRGGEGIRIVASFTALEVTIWSVVLRVKLGGIKEKLYVSVSGVNIGFLRLNV